MEGREGRWRGGKGGKGGGGAERGEISTNEKPVSLKIGSLPAVIDVCTQGKNR